MSSSKPSETSAPAKKRRSFFSTNLVPNLPAVAPSKPAIVPPRHQVLAALSEPQENTPSSSRPKREPKQKVVEAENGEATVNTPNGAGGSAKRTRPARRTSPPPTPPLESSSSVRPLRRRNDSLKRQRDVSVDDTDASNKRKPVHPPFFKSPSNTLASKHLVSTSIRQGRKADAKTLLFAPPKAKGPPPSKDENAQSINERLSQMMMQSMRATIGGRDEANQRVPVWRDNHTVKRKKIVRVSAPPPPPPKRSIALTARQRAKQKAKDDREAKEAAEQAAEEELYEDVPMDVEGEEETPKKDKGKGKEKNAGGPSKKYMTSGFYCQDANAKSPFKLVNQVLSRQPSSSKRKAGGASGVGKHISLLKSQRGSTLTGSSSTATTSFPPLPYDHGYDHFFGSEHDFVLPYNIHKEATNGALNDKKKPAPYQKIRGNSFPERARMTAERAICKCDPESGCGDNCINRIMSYLCGKDCPCGESCTNRSLARRPMAETKVKYTGTRGFGLFAMQDIKEGDFVTDYRGEVIALDTFMERLETDYAGVKNFYALAYDQDEVIDSGMRGNDARFINHGCDPNLEVRKYQTIGDGLEEYEIGMWAVKDIKQGEELFYNYNFDWFAEAKDELRTQCRCGAANCIGYLGRKAGEKHVQDVVIEVASKKAAEAARATVKGRKGKAIKKLAKTGKVKYTGAVERAKQTIAARTTKAAAKASAFVSPDKGPAVNPDEVDELEDDGIRSRNQDQGEEVDMQGGDNIDVGDATSEWVDMSMEIDQERDSDDSSEEDRVGGAIVGVIAEIARDIVNNPSEWMNDSEDGSNEDPDNGEETAGLDREEETNGRASSPAASSESSAVPYRPKDRIVSPSPITADAPIIVGSSSSVQVLSDDSARSGSEVDQLDEDSPPAPIASSSRNQDIGTENPDEKPTGDPSEPPTEEQSRAAIAAAKRKSGWSNWLRKIAAEKTRTLEEWHEERMKRRRGIAWMNMMIAEYGVAPSPTPTTTEAYSDGRKPAGSVGSFANTLAAQGHGPGPEGVRNLGGPKNKYRSDNWKKTKEEQMKYAQAGGSTSADGTDPSPAGPSIASPSPVLPSAGRSGATKSPSHAIDGSQVDSTMREPPRQGGRVDASQPLEAYQQPGPSTAQPPNPTSAIAPGLGSYKLVDVQTASMADKPTWQVAAMAPTWRVQSTVPGQETARVTLPPSTFTPPDNARPVKAPKRAKAAPRRTSMTKETLHHVSHTASSSNPAGPSLPSPSTIASTTPPARPYSTAPLRRLILGWSPDVPPTIANPRIPVMPSHNTPVDIPSSPPAMPLFSTGGPDPSPIQLDAPPYPAPFTISPMAFAPRNQVDIASSSSPDPECVPKGPLPGPETFTQDATPASHPLSSKMASSPSVPIGDSPATTSRRTANKQKAIAKRNGAPMGWAYEVVANDTPDQGAREPAVEENLPRSARRARVSLLRDDAIKKEGERA